MVDANPIPVRLTTRHLLGSQGSADQVKLAVMTRIELPARPRILVISLRRLGDVLLTTPLIRSLRRAWPDATIEALVFANTVGILEGNPDLDGVIAMPVRPTTIEGISLTARLWNRYALAVSTQTGDRPTFFAFAAGRTRIAPVEQRLSGYIKRLALHRSIPVASTHRVQDVLRLAAALGITPVPEVVCPQGSESPFTDGPYAVIHAAPMFRYKRWTRDGWRELAAALADRGLAVVATGSPDEAERSYLDNLWNGMASVRRLDGRSWPEVAALLSTARVFVGPDTSVTHLAAAKGCATVALYGPTDPRVWGPWPIGGLDVPWDAAGALQRRGNVWLVQNPLPCTPCRNEGCERRLDSYSRCLDELSVRQVLSAVDQALSVAAPLST
jgi:heptosyltransferase III